jgi:cell division protein FtsL
MSQPSTSDMSQPSKPPFVRLVKGQEVNLGCGALIIIAIIVAVCSGSARTDLSPVINKLDKMDQRIQAIEKKLDELSKKPEK